MQLIIFNTTASTITYLSGTVSVGASSSTAVTSPFLQLSLATDGHLRSDILLNNVYLTDGTNNFGNNDAIGYLYQIIQNIGPNSDGLGNNLTSTSINGKQRLDINTASEGADGSVSPFQTIQVGGKDTSGNLQSFLTDTNGNQIVLLKDANGNNLNAINNQLQTRDVINVSSQFRAQSVTTTAAQALGAATILANRKVICITPTNGTIYWGTSNAVTTTTGTPLFAFQTLTLAFTDNVPVWVISAGTVDTRILEAS